MTGETAELPMDSIVSNPNQPRKSFDEASLKELATSIEEHGLLQPILVRPIGNGKYQIVHGERRWRACKLIGLETIKAQVRKIDDKEVLEIQLVENLQRENLNSIEEAETFRKMIEELGYTHEAIAKKITEGHARALISLEENKQKEIFNEILAEGLSVRQVEEVVKTNEDVSPETIGVAEDGVVVGVWIPNETYSSLLKVASSKKVTIEKLCSQIIKEVARCQLK